MNPYESFYHGLVVSKLWLCEELEKILDMEGIKKPAVSVLGGWHNLMSFMMIIRQPQRYLEFNSYDIDAEATDVANKICDTWKFEEPRVFNHTKDVATMDFSRDNNTVYINCSVDQFRDTFWYNTIPRGMLVCLQTTDADIDSTSWEITQQTKTLDEFKEKYKLSTILYAGSKEIGYIDKFLYNRLMLIGYK